QGQLGTCAGLAGAGLAPVCAIVIMTLLLLEGQQSHDHERSRGPGSGRGPDRAGDRSGRRGVPAMAGPAGNSAATAPATLNTKRYVSFHMRRDLAVTTLTLAHSSVHRDEPSFLLQRVQPAMTGLIDGSLSTLAPIFAVALAT